MVDYVLNPVTDAYFGTSIIPNEDSEFISYVSYIGGYNSPSNRVVTGVRLYCENIYEEQFRVAIYAGGSADDPSGATLLKDFGVTSLAPEEDPETDLNMIVINLSVSDYITLPADTYIWLGIKGDTTELKIIITDKAAHAGSFQSSRGKYTETTTNKLPDISWPSAIPTGGSFTNSWFYGQFILQTIDAVNIPLILNNIEQVQNIDNNTLSIPGHLIIASSDQIQTSISVEIFDPDVLRINNIEQSQDSSALDLASLSVFLSVFNSQQRHLDDHITMVNARGKLRIAVEIIV